jgi:hypothetical protein
MARKKLPTPPRLVQLGYRSIDITPAEYDWELKNKKCHGQFDRVKKEIIYSARHNDVPNELLNTIFHELLHAVMNLAGSEHINDVHEEQIVTMVANGLTELCIRNPDFVEWVKDVCEMIYEEKE